MMADNTIKVRLVKSMSGRKRTHRDTVRGLGLKRLHQTVELEDTASVRGMISKVFYLVRIEA